MSALTRRTALAGTAAAAFGGPLLLTAAARAQTPLSGTGMYDHYVLATLRIGAVSMVISDLAVNRAVNPEVLRFAEMEISEQMTVEGILHATGVPEAASPGQSALQMTPTENELVTRLTETPAGEDFDLAYIEGQISVHEDLRQVQQTLLGETEPTLETITARLLDQAAASDLVTLSFLQVLLAQRRILRLEGLESAEQQPAAEEPPVEE